MTVRSASSDADRRPRRTTGLLADLLDGPTASNDIQDVERRLILNHLMQHLSETARRVLPPDRAARVANWFDRLEAM